MEKKKSPNPLGNKAKACLTPVDAMALATKHLNQLGEVRRSLLSKFAPEIKAYLYKRTYIWLMSSCASKQNSRSCLSLYVEVKSSEVHDEIINLDELKDIDKSKCIRINNATFWYDGNQFSPFKNEIFMNLLECDELWQREKENHLLHLKSHNYTVYDHPKPMFNGLTPVFVVAFHHQMYTQNVETLVVYPNLGKLTTRVFSKSNWRKMIREMGASIIKENAKITITENGFEIGEP